MTYESDFWNALGHGMNEDQADAYASRRSRERKQRKVMTTAELLEQAENPPPEGSGR